MTDDTTQPGVRIDASVWDQFREDVEARKGGVRGHLKAELETALREYINASEGGDTHDRLTRIEGDIQNIATTLAEIQSKEKDSDVGSTVQDRADEIEQFIRDETGKSPVVGDQVVEMAIKRIAGHSDPTLSQYKDILQERGSLYPHPKQSNKFVRDKQEFVVMTQQMGENSAIPQQRYREMVDYIGEDEFVSVYDEWDTDPGGRGVQ